MRETNFDGIPGPTHNYGGLSPGNVASIAHEGKPSNPRAAALQGLKKMRLVAGLGVGQAVLPPHRRPDLGALRRLGFAGSDEQVLARAARDEEHLLRLCSSASAMWTANAATVVPAADSGDGRLHLVPANLQSMFHRSLEGDTTYAVLRAIFADERRFAVHRPLPGGGQLADEGAANHTRLEAPGRPAVHLFAWGRRAWGEAPAPARFPARQTLEASRTVARLAGLDDAQAVFAQKSPEAIDAGAFHADVVCVGTAAFFMMHERAFVDGAGLIDALRARLGDALRVVVAGEAELPLADAVAAYPFNSQLLTLADGSLTILAPAESRDNPAARGFLDRVVAEDNAVTAVTFVDLRQSMENGGGPACLRLRVPLEDADARAIAANVLFTDELDSALVTWVEHHYRDRLTAADLADPALAREGMTALDELTRLLRLGSVYDFQR